MYLGSKISKFRPCFLIKRKMIADLQDAGKSPNEKQRITIRRIILILEDK